MKFIKSKQYYKFILSGIIFTLIGPSFFLFLCLYLPVEQAAIFNELFIHSIRYKILKYYVFKSKLANPLDYLVSILPLSLFNICLAYYFKDIFTPVQIASISIIYSLTIGYLITRLFFNKK